MPPLLRAPCISPPCSWTPLLALCSPDLATLNHPEALLGRPQAAVQLRVYYYANRFYRILQAENASFSETPMRHLCSHNWVKIPNKWLPEIRNGRLDGIPTKMKYGAALLQLSRPYSAVTYFLAICYTGPTKAWPYLSTPSHTREPGNRRFFLPCGESSSVAVSCQRFIEP